MHKNRPEWTTPIVNQTVKGIDQLGIEGAAQSYQQEILPGIITVTEHARYYSFYAWVLYRFIFDDKSSLRLKDFRGQYFKRHEMALILSGYVHHSAGKPFTGIVGSGTNNVKVKRFWGDADETHLDHDYFQNTLGGFGQYYRTAMQVMGILEEPEAPGLVDRLTHRGKALAEAYQESIQDTRYFQALNERGRPPDKISRDEAVEYAQVGCLCPDALRRGKDRAFLLDTFFRLEEPQQYDNLHVRRRNSLGVALDLIYQANGQFRRDHLRPALYIGEYSPGVPYPPAEEIKDWVARWRMVEVRHMYTFALQCLWAAFLWELHAKGAIRQDEWPRWIEERLQALGWNLSIPRLAEKFCAEAGVDGGFATLQKEMGRRLGMQSGLDEYSLYLQAAKNAQNAELLFQAGTRILLLLYLRQYPYYQSQTPIWWEMAEKERLPLAMFFQDMGQGLQNTRWRVADWLNEIYQRYIFEQHEIIALEKLRFQEYDTFKFYYDNGIFYWPAEKSPYQEPIRLAANRLDNCITMLLDLGLILEDEQGRLVLSEEGKEYRIRVLERF